jgi:hypothetical protein
MSFVRCEICRSYYDPTDEDSDHRCHGLRSVDWVRFLHSLRKWMDTDKHARFEVYYARYRKARRSNGSPN